MWQFTGNQFKAISNKKIHSDFSVLIIFLGIVSCSQKTVFYADEVFLVLAVQLVATMLPGQKIALIKRVCPLRG